MKQRSSSFQISDILGLPPKERNSPGDGSTTPGQTTIPPPSISSALHSSNNTFATCSAPNFNQYPPPAPTLPPKSPFFEPEPRIRDPQFPTMHQHMQFPSDPIESTPIPGQVHQRFANGLTDFKPSTGGYLPANLSSSMFFESSAAAAAAHHYLYDRDWLGKEPFGKLKVQRMIIIRLN